MCEEHGQGYDTSGRPMVTEVEVWPLAADQTGIWLLEPTGPWPSEVVTDDMEPHDFVRLVLDQHGAPADLFHATSWRIEHDPVSGRNYQRNTYMAVIACEGLVPAEWPDALPVTTLFAEEVGPAPTHGPTEAPTVPWSHVLLHGLRHLRFLLTTDATVAAALTEAWGWHLASFDAAIARMYQQVHEAV